MPGYFPKIHPDELLASAVARYHVHTRSISHRTTHMELYNSPHSRTSVKLPRNLKEFHKSTQLFTGLTLRQLVAQTTLYPYYFAFAQKEAAVSAYRKMLAKSGQSHSIVLGWDPVLDKLKVCSSCIKSDIETYGEAYWHRSHQLHASHLCSTHAEPLLLTDTRYFNHYNTPLEQLTVDIGTKKYLPQMSEKTRQRLMEIAAYGERYLNGESGQNGIQPFSETGRAHLRRVYPGHQKDTLDMTKIEKEVVNHFGEECLEILGLSIEPGVRTGWVREIFRSTPSPMPTKHIIFKLLIEHVVLPKPETATSDILERMPKHPWACQNPAADHCGQIVVTEVYKVPNFKVTGVLGFRCDCGYTFLAETKSWNFGCQPKKIKVQEFGDVFIARVRGLKAAGASVSEISRKLDTRRSTIYAMLKEGYGSYERIVPQKANEVRREKAAVYAASGDRERKLSSGRPRKVDYNARDLEYVERFIRAEAQIRLTSPPVRASVNHILEVVGVRYSHLVRQKLFPLSLAKLRELGESTESIRTRREEWAARAAETDLKTSEYSALS